MIPSACSLPCSSSLSWTGSRRFSSANLPSRRLFARAIRLFFVLTLCYFQAEIERLKAIEALKEARWIGVPAWKRKIIEEKEAADRKALGAE